MTIDHERKQIYAVAVGSIRYEEIEHHLVEERSLKGLPYKEFIDAVDATLSFVLYPSEIRQIVALIRALGKESNWVPPPSWSRTTLPSELFTCWESSARTWLKLSRSLTNKEARAWLDSKLIDS
jgi:hypothetical protein